MNSRPRTSQNFPGAPIGGTASQNGTVPIDLQLGIRDGRDRMMVVFRGYLVIFEGNDESGYSAHCPDLPGVAAAGPTPRETQQLMLEAVDDHIAMLQKTGQPVPKPGSTAA